MKPTTNPVALQSQKWIVSSLLALMGTEDYAKISIKDIAEHADLDRRTFYRNFRSKEDVLASYIKGMCDEYVEALSAENSPSTFLTAKVYFLMCEKHIVFLNLLKDQGLLEFLLIKYNESIPSLLQQNILQDFKQYYGNNIGFLYAFTNGGFWNLSIRWLLDGATQRPEEMAHIVCKIVQGMSECRF